MTDVAANEGILARPEKWEFKGACVNISEDAKETFFLHGEQNERFAKSICNNMCEVREECLDWALRKNIRYGVLGGLSEKERSSMRRKMYRKNEARYQEKERKKGFNATSVEVVSVERAS